MKKHHPYGLRLKIRGFLPWFLINLGIAGKGKDCESVGAEHLWYNKDGIRQGCYYCEQILEVPFKKVDCPFCHLIKYKTISPFAENPSFVAMLDGHPVTAGHSIVISKRCISSVFDLTSSEWSDLQDILKQSKQFLQEADLETLYKKLLDETDSFHSQDYYQSVLGSNQIGKKPVDFTIGINDGATAGQTVPHLHVHLIPRYEGDVPDPRGGVRNVIPEKGNYKK